MNVSVDTLLNSDNLDSESEVASLRRARLGYITAMARAIWSTLLIALPIFLFATLITFLLARGQCA
ncbi:MAG: hypothetical protein WDN76_07790 [Alphaproteobacteria bacterium]